MADEKTTTTTTDEKTTEPAVIIFGKSELKTADAVALLEKLKPVAENFDKAQQTFMSDLMANTGKGIDGYPANTKEMLPIAEALMGLSSALIDADENNPVIPQIEFSPIMNSTARENLVKQLIQSTGISEADAKAKLKTKTSLELDKNTKKMLGEYLKMADEYTAAISHNKSVSKLNEVETKLNENPDAVKSVTEMAATLGVKPEDLAPMVAKFILDFGKLKGSRSSGTGSTKSHGSMVGTVSFEYNGKTFSKSGLEGTDLLKELHDFGVPVDQIAGGRYIENGQIHSSNNGSKPKYQHVSKWLIDNATNVSVKTVSKSKVDGVDDLELTFAENGTYYSNSSK